MGGSGSTEFMVPTEAGEDLIASCEACGYAANTEKAGSRIETRDSFKSDAALEEFATPGVVTIEALEKQPYGVKAEQQLKTLIYVGDDQPLLAIVRGDDQLNEAKLQTASGAAVLRPAHAEEIQKWLGAKPGSLGGVGLGAKKELRVFLDLRLQGLSGLVTGANKDGFHLRNVSVPRDLGHAQPVDLRTISAGEGCQNCGKPLAVGKSLEVGHIFKLGTRYSESMGARVLDPAGKELPIVMGSYGIGVERILAAAVELHHDQDGIRWPMSIAPYHLALLPLQMQDEAVRGAAEKLYGELQAAGVEVLLDDRDERAGVKFKDADLVGLPLRIAIGKKGLAEGKVEWKARGAAEVQLVPLAEVIAKAQAAVREGGGKLSR
jgi:prolyl-tRNA synthetase